MDQDKIKTLKLGKYKITYNSAGVFMIIFLAAIFSLPQPPIKSECQLLPDVMAVYYKNLSTVETTYANTLLENIRPEYLEGLRSITFTKNRLEKNTTGNLSILGIHDIQKNTIIIHIQKIIAQDKDVLCHELLHAQGISNEKIVRQLEKLQPCYETEKLS